MKFAARLMLACAALALAGAKPTVAAEDAADETIRALARRLGQSEPLVRIGLEDAPRIRLRSSTALYLMDPATGRPVAEEAFRGELVVLVLGGPPEPLAPVFRVQVGAYHDEERARAEAARLRAVLSLPVALHRDPDRGVWRLRLGAARNRDGLGEVLERLRRSGLGDAWIVEEPPPAPPPEGLRLVDEAFVDHPVPAARLVAYAAGGAHVEVEGKPYRGLVELRATPAGTVRPVNWIHIEEYLLGVVPAELGPEVWPQLEALKAQAVAARTYAWRNRGQFEAFGFDLCASPRCQVYGGVLAEHPISDRAVYETAGEILAFRGKPIQALYTATCGGHTEDVELIFPEERAPYLRGVACRAESRVLERMHVTLRGREPRSLIAEDGTDLSRPWALLVTLGVIEPTLGEAALREPVSGARLREWTRRLALAAGRPAPAGPPPRCDSLGEAALALLRDLGWEERARVLLDEADLPALLRDPEARELPPPQRRALGYLVGIEALRPFPDGSLGVARPPSAARLIPALLRFAETYGVGALVDGVFAGLGARGLRFAVGKGDLELPLARDAFLFGLTGGRVVGTATLDLWPGDRVRLRQGERGAVEFLELAPPVRGTSDDRAAAVYSWEERRSAAEIERAVRRRTDVGRLEDLRVLRRGRSGRIVELEVVGDSGRTVVRGFDIRRLLDLRESLTVVELQRDSAGGLRGAVFTGKGWGHGVGLCQVGAYGMALRGADYREILHHYYTGVELRRIE